MDLANIITFVSLANVDPSTAPEIDDSPEVVETLVGRNLPKPERASKKQAMVKNQAAPIHNQASAPGVLLNTGDKLDAKSFILAMRNAGKRWVEKDGVTRQVFDRNHERPDQIQAIASYCGYDNSRDFGSQQQAAMAQAQREMRGPQPLGPSREEQRAATKSLAGFVHGMPAPQQRLVRDLQARAVSLAESRDKATSAIERSQFQVMLDATNKALAELGF